MYSKVYLLCLLFFCTTANAASCKATATPINFSDSLQVKLYSKGNILKVSANPTINGGLRLRVKSSEDLHFYVFDLSGTLIHRATLNGKSGSKLPPLQKGTYLYDVFKNDLSIEEGRIVIQ